MFGIGTFGTLTFGQLPDPPPDAHDSPPFRYGGPIAIAASIVAITQPNPWTYSFVGGASPFHPHLISPGIPGQSVNNPPFDRRTAEIRAELIGLTQSNPWVYAFAGSQPYAPLRRLLGVPGYSADPPPFRHPERGFAIAATIVAQNQPSTWPYSFVGARQPYEGKKNSPGIPGQSADPPPLRHPERSIAIAATLVQASQPPIWPYSFIGATQPYEAKKLSPGIPGQSVDQPPYDRRRADGIALAVALNQPPIWNYTFEGGAQPYAPRRLPPEIVAVPVPIPGAGKRRDFPSYIAQPALDAKPNKPFRPIWDRPRQAAIEEPKPAPQIVRPPLPPAALFGTPGHAGYASKIAPQIVLPKFEDYAPPDPLRMTERMQDARDKSDVKNLLDAASNDIQDQSDTNDVIEALAALAAGLKSEDG